MDEAGLISHIDRLPHGRANYKQLVRELGSRGVKKQEIETLLSRLVESGDLLELRGGHYILTARNRQYVAGRLRMHRDGYGFVIADKALEGIEGDIFIGRDGIGSAMHGDRVICRIAKVTADRKADGEIVKILRRAHTEVVGEFSVRRTGNWVIPADTRLQHWIQIVEGEELPAQAQSRDRVGVKAPDVRSVEDLDGMIVNVEILDFGEEDGKPAGRVIEVIGHPDDFGVDVEVIIRKHHVPHRFPEDVIAQAEAVAKEVSPEERDERRDFRDMPIVTIDGETARDFDDAVWVDRLPNGNWALHVHIADVSHYVKPGSPIDTEARLRGTSVYFPDRAVPMLPPELSTEICSLKPQVDRLVMSALLEIDGQGDTVACEFTRGVIRSAERMTYTAVHALLEGDAALRERYAPLVERFEKMRELALILNRKRVKRGSIDFDLPEPLIEFDEFGQMVGITRSPRNIAHRLIEEFMLAANEAVAAHLESLDGPMIYRIHEPPDPKRILEFEEIAVRYGHSLDAGPIKVKKFGMVDRKRDGRKVRKDLVMVSEDVSVTSRNYQKLVARIEGRPEERILSYLMLRSLKQARYHAVNFGHFALAASTYTHFTSPIRRYPDLLVHRLLGAWLDSKPGPDAPEIRQMAAQCSVSERRAADAERDLVEWKKAKFMSERVGEDFNALVISTSKAGMFVELEDLFVEGLVTMEAIAGDRFIYHENTRRIVGQRTRKEYGIGDHVRVLLDRVDAADHRLMFSVHQPGPGRKHRQRQ